MFTDKDGTQTGNFGESMIAKRPPSSDNKEEVETTETPTDTTVEESPTDNPVEEVETDTEEKPEDKPESSETSEEEETEKKEDVANANEEIKPFTVDFDEKEEAEQEESEEQRDSASVSEEQVLDFLKTNNPDLKGIESLADISQKVTLPPAVQEFHDFMNETNGRGIEDYYNMRKDWSNESEEAAIREHLKLSEEGITDEDIDDFVDLMRVPTDDEEANFTDTEIRERRTKWRTAHRKAMKYLGDLQKKYNTPLESQGQPQKPLTEAEIAKMLTPYWNQRDKSLEGFNEYGIKTSLGDITVKITEDEKNILKEAMTSQETFFEDWKAKDGGINTDQAVIDMAFRIPKIRNRILKEIMSQTNTLSLEKLSKSQRNVDLQGRKTKKNVKPTVAMEEIDSSGASQQTYGESIVKKRS